METGPKAAGQPWLGRGVLGSWVCKGIGLGNPGGPGAALLGPEVQLSGTLAGSDQGPHRVPRRGRGPRWRPEDLCPGSA